MNEHAQQSDENDAAGDCHRSSSIRSGRAVWLPLMPVLLAACVLAVDYVTKEWALATLTEGRAVLVVGEALQWLLVMNPGAAFSFASGATWIFTLLSTGIAILICWNLRKVRSRAWAVFLGLVLGGTLGNLMDRLFREPGFPVGHVVDFIYTPWMMPAIYNVADIAVVSGMGLFVIVTFMGISIRGTRAPKRVKNISANDLDASEAQSTPESTND